MPELFWLPEPSSSQVPLFLDPHWFQVRNQQGQVVVMLPQELPASGAPPE
jgi:hypothetical protein